MKILCYIWDMYEFFIGAIITIFMFIDLLLKHTLFFKHIIEISIIFIVMSIPIQIKHGWWGDYIQKKADNFFYKQQYFK